MKKFLTPGSFLANVAILSTGTVLAQVITIGAAPILTRLYSPAEMGSLAGLMAIISILGIVATGRYDLAVLLPEKELDATMLAMLGIASVFGVSSLVSLAFVLFGTQIAFALGLSEVPRQCLILVGVSVLLIGSEHVFTRIAIRGRRYRSLASAAVGQQLGANGFKVAAGFAGAGVGGLFLGTLFGHIVRTGSLAYNARNRIGNEDGLPGIKRLLEMARRYKKFPLISTWSALLNSASVQVPVILFAALFSPAVAGYYSLSHRILQLPMTFVGRNVGHLFIERAARAQDNPEELKRLTLGLYTRLLLIGVIGMSFVTFYGDVLFPFVFGTEWAEAGRYAQWISVWLVFVLAASPLSSMYPVTERQGEALLFNAIMFVSRIGVIVIGAILPISNYELIAIFSVIGALLWLVMSARVLHIAHVPYLYTAAVTLIVCILKTY